MAYSFLLVSDTLRYSLKQKTSKITIENSFTLLCFLNKSLFPEALKLHSFHQSAILHIKESNKQDLGSNLVLDMVTL